MTGDVIGTVNHWKLDTRTAGVKKVNCVYKVVWTCSGGGEPLVSPHRGSTLFKVSEARFKDLYVAGAATEYIPVDPGGNVLELRIAFFPKGEMEVFPKPDSKDNNPIKGRIIQYAFGSVTTHFSDRPDQVDPAPNGLDKSPDHASGDITEGDPVQYNEDGTISLAGQDEPKTPYSAIVWRKVTSVDINLRFRDEMQYSCNGGDWVTIGKLEFDYTAHFDNATKTCTGGIGTTHGEATK